MPNRSCAIFIGLLAVLAVALPARADYEKGLAAFRQKDYAAARQAWTPLAEKGDPKAQTGLGVMLAGGLGTERDYVKAREWYRKAAEKKYVSAMHNLAVMCATGQGRDRDPEAAAEWFKKAAIRGHYESQVALAKLYASGQGVKSNPVEAYTWLLIAGGEAMDVRSLRKSLEEKLSAKQQKAARDKAKAWTPEK